MALYQILRLNLIFSTTHSVYDTHVCTCNILYSYDITKTIRISLNDVLTFKPCSSGQ